MILWLENGFDCMLAFHYNWALLWQWILDLLVLLYHCNTVSFWTAIWIFLLPDQSFDHNFLFCHISFLSHLISHWQSKNELLFLIGCFFLWFSQNVFSLSVVVTPHCSFCMLMFLRLAIISQMEVWLLMSKENLVQFVSRIWLLDTFVIDSLFDGIPTQRIEIGAYPFQF